jgi:hypothetical protein
MQKKMIVVLILFIIAAIVFFFVRHEKEAQMNPYMVNFIVTQHFCAHPGVWCSDVFCQGIANSQMNACLQECGNIIRDNPRPNCSP